MTREEYHQLFADALCFSLNPSPEECAELGEFAARVRRYLEEQGETVAWWDGGRRLTRREEFSAAHNWPNAIPLVPRYIPEQHNDS